MQFSPYYRELKLGLYSNMIPHYLTTSLKRLPTPAHHFLPSHCSLFKNFSTSDAHLHAEKMQIYCYHNCVSSPIKPKSHESKSL